MSTQFTPLTYDPRYILAYHCSHLRYGRTYDPYGALSATAVPGSYWCARTERIVGPDGQAVGADECAGGRRCCEH